MTGRPQKEQKARQRWRRHSEAMKKSWNVPQVPTITTVGTSVQHCAGCGQRNEVWWNYCAMCGQQLASG